MKRFADSVVAWGAWCWLPLLPTAYALVLAACGQARVEHAVLALVTLALAYTGPRSKRFLLEAWPVVAVGIGYDLVRYLRPIFVTPSRVLGCEMRDTELALFSFSPDKTLQDLAAIYHRPAL